jgi:hypothetical protein
VKRPRDRAAGHEAAPRIAAQLTSWRQLHHTAAPYLTGIEEAVFRHALIRVEAELTWHEEFIAALPKLFHDNETSPG